jgi:hypothetical protein
MAIFPYQDDLRTDNIGFTGCNVFPGATCGVFTSVTGTAPNRQFNIEWRATHFADTTTSANFEVVFYENSQTFFDVIYGATSDNGLDETSGVQQSSTGPATTFSCGTSTLTNGLKVTYTCAGGGTPSPTPTPTASPSCTPIVVTGSIDAGDPLQTDRLFRSGIPQTCPATTTCAIFGDSTPRHYDSYTFTNTTGATQCVTVDTNTACTGTNFIFIAAYLGSFDPNNLCTNWIGDSGGSPNPDQPFQFNLDNGQTVVVVVSEITPDAGCPAYTVTITGFCLPTVIPAGAKAVVADFNGDSHPDWVVRNVNTRQTVLVYLNDNVVIGAALGPTLTSNLALTGAADFNLDTHPDYALFAPNTFQTLLEYLSGPILIGAAFGPTLPAGWELVTTADFNGDNNPDFVIFKRSTRQTAIVFLNNNIVLGAALLLTLPAGWNLAAFADFNSDGHIDIALFNPATRQTVIGYLSGAILIGAALGPTLPMNWQPVAAADFNGDGHPDYLLYRPDTRQTEIWHLNNNVFINAVSGLTLPSGWTLLSH